MAAYITMSITGVEDLLRRFQSLLEKTRGKYIRAAVSAGANPVLNAVRRTVNVRFGVLKKAIRKKIKTYRYGSISTAVIGPQRGLFQMIDGKRIDPTKYEHLVELGTRPHRIGRRMHPGSRAFRFLEMASKSERNASISVMRIVLANALSNP